MSLSEYEARRADPNRFALKSGHELAGSETTVASIEGRYLVVSKLGAGTADACKLDPPSFWSVFAGEFAVLFMLANDRRHPRPQTDSPTGDG